MDLGPILRAMARNKLRFGLIAAQIAVTLAIVANCVTLILDARRKMSHPKTFDEDNLLRILVPCQDTALRDDRRRNLWAHEIVERLRGIPGVRGATHTRFAPYFAMYPGSVRVAGSGAPLTIVPRLSADAEFPGAVGTELDEGRWFSREEVERTEEMQIAGATTARARGPDGKAIEPSLNEAVISRALGEHLFGQGPLVGKMLEDQDGDLLRIVGVIKSLHHPWVHPSLPADQIVFTPFYSHKYAYGAQFIARAEPGQAAVVGRRIEEELSKSFGVTQKSVWLLSEGRDMAYGVEQMTVALMGLLVLLVLLVASLGVAGLTSFSVTARARQIGTRRALGATTGDIVRHFLTESGLLTAIGLVAGAGLAVGLNIVLLKVYTDAKLSPPVVAGSALVLFLVGAFAALPPALRASRISPAVATRNV